MADQIMEAALKKIIAEGDPHSFMIATLALMQVKAIREKKHD